MAVSEALSTPRAWLAHSLAGALAVFAVLDLQDLVPVTHRILLPLAGVVLLAAAWARRSSLTRRDLRLLLASGLAASVAVAAWSSMGTVGGPDVFQLARRLTAVCTAWSVGLLLIGDKSSTGSRGFRFLRSPWALVGVLLLAAGGAVLAQRIVAHRYVSVVDENLYLLQSRLFDRPGAGLPLAESEQPFFAVRQTFVRDGRMRTQYPPGWPALLELFRGLGLRRWSGPILLALALGFVFLLGRRLHSTEAGIIAVTLLGTSPLVVRFAGTYMAHAASLACVTGAAWLLLRAEVAPGRTRLGAWAGAGAVVGVAIAIRPLTGVLMGCSLALWLILRRRLSGRELVRGGAIVALGALPALAATLLYNGVTTGDPLTFGYRAANGPLHDFGFGLRGFVDYDSLGQRYVLAREFTPRTAVVNMGRRVWEFLTAMMPVFLSPALLLLAVHHRVRVQWLHIAGFLLLPAAHFFYFYSEPRFFIELLPFCFAGAGVVLAAAADRRPLAARMVLVLALAGNLFLAVATIRAARPGGLELYREIDAAQRRHARLLVFVPQGCGDAPRPPGAARRCGPFTMLSWYNVDSFPGPVVVARDLGSTNVELLRRYPSHVPMRVLREPRTDVFRLVPYGPGDARADTGR